MKGKLGFFETLRISCFDYRSYLKFLDMSFGKIIFNRIIFVLLITIPALYVSFFSNDMKFLENIRLNKESIFYEDVSFNNGMLNISNSPVVYSEVNGAFGSKNKFLFIGDTRDSFDINQYSEISKYKKALVLANDHFVLKDGLRKFKIKYTDLGYKNLTLSKQDIFSVIDMVSSIVSKVIYIVIPLINIFNFFFIALIASLLASIFSLAFSSLIKVRVKFVQIYKVMLFAQTMPFIVSAVYELIGSIFGVGFIIPVHLVEIFTLIIFLISMIQIGKDRVIKK